jgi:hypothetical protein
MTDLVSAAVGPGDTLAWLRSTLWSDRVDIRFRPGPDGDLCFLVRPLVDQPELLVPAQPPAAAAAVARRTSDARTIAGRLRTTAVEVAAASGLIPRLAPSRLLGLDLGVGADDPSESVPALAQEVFGLDDAVFAVTMGAPRYNRKPVLTVLDGKGRIRGFVKVGVDPHTDEGVATEAAWLARISASGQAGFEVPAVISSTSWQGHPVLMTAPVTPPRLPVRRDIDNPPPGLVESIGSLDAGLTTVPMTEPVRAARGIDDRLQVALDRVLERHGSTQVRVGAWHGDLSPWNMASRRNGPPLVWDWEAAAVGRPIGADLLHSRVMVPTHLRGVSPQTAVGRLDGRIVA